MNDLVSILIPVYNRQKFIGDSIRSALAQTHSALEVIVVDNASTDATWSVIQEMSKSEPRLKAFRNATNIGPVRNWIECARHAKGTYAKILWSDDLIAPTFVERCLPYLKNSDTAFVYSAALVFQGNVPTDGGTVSYQKYGLKDTVISSKAFIDGVLQDGNFPFSPGCAIFRTEELRANLWKDVPNCHSSDFSMHAIGNDLLLFLLTAQQHPSVVVVGEMLSFFRAHVGSISEAAGKGRLFFHYDLVKAYFCARFFANSSTQQRFNSRLKIHLTRFKPAPYGIRTYKDFYEPGSAGNISYLHVVLSWINLIFNKASWLLLRKHKEQRMLQAWVADQRIGEK